ncbi:Ubiquitin carboxyl-terminal hydrolase [Aphelenchoides besseyi]|nr:Ubiquitin carboxyl-terminal hydrolase [Aphelenchoides besseyi]
MAPVQWIPLESNPDVFNEFIEKLGIKGARCVDVYGFDDELIEYIPKPHLALIFVDEIMQPVYNKLAAEGVKTPEKVFFMKQKDFKCLWNFRSFSFTRSKRSGSFAEWLREAKNLSVEERSDSLGNAKALSEAHESVANHGETDANPPKVEHHFIAYVNIDGTLYEFDSRMDFPRACGPTTQETLIKDAGVFCKDLAAKLNNPSFSALALVGEE